MTYGIFNDAELELIEAAKMVLSDGVQRLKGRENLFPLRGMKRDERSACRDGRRLLTEKLIADYGSLRYEVAVAVMIDAQGRLIEIEQFPQGKASEVEMNARLLAGMVLKHGAAAVLLAHNHPSGDNTPSQQDEKVTTMLQSWLAVMDCKLLDHLVLNGEDASSITGEWQP
jgi:DNA repair protein RadC